jgi:hypothetical protein
MSSVDSSLEPILTVSPCISLTHTLISHRKGASLDAIPRQPMPLLQWKQQQQQPPWCFFFFFSGLGSGALRLWILVAKLIEAP